MQLPRIGELNRRVVLRKRVDAPVFESAIEETFPFQKPRWAKIEPVGTAIYSEGVQAGSMITHRIFMRFIDGITEAHEVVRKDNVYRVKRVTDVQGRERFTVLEVEQLK